MAQFDVYRNPVDDQSDAIPYVLDIQADLLEHLNSRVVVPLIRADLVVPPIPRLNPRFVVANGSVFMATTLIGGLPVSSLREVITNLGDRREDIIGAIDMLVSGV